MASPSVAPTLQPRDAKARPLRTAVVTAVATRNAGGRVGSIRLMAARPLEAAAVIAPAAPATLRPVQRVSTRSEWQRGQEEGMVFSMYGTLCGKTHAEPPDRRSQRGSGRCRCHAQVDKAPRPKSMAKATTYSRGEGEVVKGSPFNGRKKSDWSVRTNRLGVIRTDVLTGCRAAISTWDPTPTA